MPVDVREGARAAGDRDDELAGASRCTTAPESLSVPPGSRALPLKVAVWALVNVSVPLSEPTRAPFFLPNCAAAFTSRSR